MVDSRQDAPDFSDSRDSFLWPDGTTGPWMIRVDWSFVAGRYECVGLTIRSYREAYPIGVDTSGNPVAEEWPPELPPRWEATEVLTASTLRRLALGEVIDDLRRSIVAEQYVPLIAAAAAEGADEIDQELATMSRQQAAAWLDDNRAHQTHREVAEVYTAAWRDGNPPTKAVSEHFTISQSAAAKRVARAREAGLLPQTRRGMSQGRKREDD